MCIVFIYSELLTFKGGYMSVFDIVGPVMIGPSSSHTAGAARIGLMLFIWNGLFAGVFF